MADHNSTDQNDHSAEPATDPRKKNDPADEIVNSEEENVVNNGEQDDPFNETNTGKNQKDESTGKQQGYKEGTKDDYLNDPSLKDSDAQPEFPDEEG